MKYNNIVYVHFSLNYDGGIGTVIRQLAIRQVKSGYEVYLAADETNAETVKTLANKCKCEVILYHNRKSLLPRSVIGNNLKKIIGRQFKNKCVKPVLICHGVGVIGLLGSIPQNTFVVLHGHINCENSKSFLFYNLLLYKLKKKCQFISCSIDCAQYFFSKYKLKSRIIQNGLDTVTTKEMYYPNKKLTIGMISYLDEHKGFRFFLDAITILSKKNYDFEYYIAGHNDENFNFSEFIYKNNLINKLHFLGEVKNAANTILPMCDIIVLPSVMEGLPMSLIEAQSYGIPILATDVGGIPEILKDGYNGYFIKRNGDDIADKITKCSDIGNYIKLSQNSKDLYMQNFTAEKMFSNYENFINETIGSVEC